MSRYIDKDKVLKIVNDMTECEDDYARITEWVNNMSSIDIVRCKECKYDPICSHSVQHTTHEPTTVTIGYKSVDSCSYGERKTDE